MQHTIAMPSILSATIGTAAYTLERDAQKADEDTDVELDDDREKRTNQAHNRRQKTMQ